MSILAIARNFDGDPNIVTIVTDDDLTAITTTGYWDLPETKDSVALLQNGEWEWAATDLVLIHYDTTLIGFFVYDALNATFDALNPTGGLADTLQNGNIFVGNASNIATGVAPSGDITLSNTGVFGIAAGVIVNADINAAAAISFSKLAALPSADILVGSAGGVATSVAVTGDVTISNVGVTAIATGVIVNADINASAAIDFSKLAALASGNILVGSAGNVATSVAMSGDVTISNTGVSAIGSGKVVLAMLATGIHPAGVIKFMGQPTSTGGGGATEAYTVTGALAASDRAFVQVVNNGTNNVTILQAVVTNDTLTITYSGDPAADTVFNYQLIRAAA